MGLIEKIKKISKKYFQESNSAHDWGHTLRVYDWVLRLAEKENADEQTVAVAALLHDIGRKKEDQTKGKVDHAQVGSEQAALILQAQRLDKKMIKQVCHCIRSHRFRTNTEPKTIEAKVLFDADKLDSIGAIGIARVYYFAGENGSVIYNPDVNIDETEQYSSEDSAYREFIVKLSKVKDRLYTESGRKIAENRHDYMVKFFQRLNKEIKGQI
jgi:uncharacterized protein